MQPSRLKVGLDVPWVTSWTEERMLGPAPCMTVPGMLAAAQAHKPGFGRPVYSQNHFIRQRMSVRRMLCPMCGEPTLAGDRWTLTARRMSAGMLRRKGLKGSVPAELADARIVIDAGAVAPQHYHCATRSMVKCPHLSADPDLDLQPFADRWFVSPLFASLPTMPMAVMAKPVRPPPPLVCFLQLCGVTDEMAPA